jgi:hypothetical protein
MTPTQKAELLKQAIPPEALTAVSPRGLPKRWWQRGDWGFDDHDGIHARGEILRWDEVHSTLQAGANSGKGHTYAYADAVYEHWAWERSSGQGHLSEADKAERLVWRDRISERLRETAWAIIDAGCERYVAPEPLFEMGGLQ